MQLGPFHFVRVTLWMAFKKSAQIDLWAKRQVEEGGGTCSQRSQHCSPPPSPKGVQEGSPRSVHKSYFIVCSPPPSPLFVSAFLALSWGDAWRLWRSGEPHWEVLWSYLSHVMFPVRSNTTGVPRSSHGKPAKHFLHSTPPFLLFLSACLAIFFLSSLSATACGSYSTPPPSLPPSPTCTVLSLCHKGFHCLPSAVASMTRLYQTLTLDSFFFFFKAS